MGLFHHNQVDKILKKMNELPQVLQCDVDMKGKEKLDGMRLTIYPAINVMYDNFSDKAIEQRVCELQAEFHCHLEFDLVYPKRIWDSLFSR